MKFLYKVIFIFLILKFKKNKKEVKFSNLNFRRLDFTNYKHIKSFIFKKNFHLLKNKYVDNFEFLNFSQNLGGKIGINLSRNNIFDWYAQNKNKISFPWTEDLTSKRLINILYNYDFINSSATKNETNLLNKIIIIHMQRLIFNFKSSKISEISSYDLIAYFISILVLNINIEKNLTYLNYIIPENMDSLGMHKSYNVLEHAKFLNNLYELKNVLLYFDILVPEIIDKNILKMNSILNEYFHLDGSIPLFNGANNNYTNLIYESLNKDEYLKTRNFSDTSNGLAFYADKKTKLFFDVVQPNKNKVSNNLSAGTLSFEFSCLGEKIITNCGASESSGKNPEYLRYSAAHSTIILQNTNISEVKEKNPHIKFPQSVTFNSSKSDNKIVFEGSHNGYDRKFRKVIKRKISIYNNESKLFGEDNIITIKNNNSKIIYHIRFHLVSGINYNFTNNKKNLILKTKNNNIWIFKSDVELVVEDSIIVDNNTIIPTKQIVIKGLIENSKIIRKWSLEKM